MSLLDLNQAPAKIIPRGNGSIATPSPARANDDVEAALSLVTEKAAAIREFERETAQALAQARNVADDLKEQLDHTDACAQRAETMLRLAEGQVEGLTADIERARHEIKTLQALLAARESELASWTSRAEEAEAGLHEVLDAIRAQLPVKLSVPTE